MRRRELLMWPVGVGAFGALGSLWIRLDPGLLLRPCPLRVLTGVPCPACGGTHALRALFAGSVGSAFRSNPLVAGGALALVTSAVVALAAIPWADHVRRPSWLKTRSWILLLGALLAANWVYLILTLR